MCYYLYTKVHLNVYISNGDDERKPTYDGMTEVRSDRKKGEIMLSHFMARATLMW